MEKPAITAPASAATAGSQERARDPETGRFGPTDGWGRSPQEREVIAARRARVELLHPMSSNEIAAILRGPEGPRSPEGRPWSTAVIAKDKEALAAAGRITPLAPGARRRLPDAEPRVCMNPSCPREGEPFTPQPWDADREYCSRRCSQPNNRSELVRKVARRLLVEQHRRAAEEVKRLNAAGWLTASQITQEMVGGKVPLSDSTVSQWISRGLLKAELQIIEGERHQLVRREEVDRFKREVWPGILERMGPNFPSNWSGRRRQSWARRTWGVHNGGRTPKPLPERLPDPAVLAAVKRLVDRGYGRPHIRERTGLSDRHAREAIEYVKSAAYKTPA